MSDYTPTRTAVRNSYISRRVRHGQRAVVARAEFEAWLAEHDAWLWDEGFAAGVNHDMGDRENIPEQIQNPYRSGS